MFKTIATWVKSFGDSNPNTFQIVEPTVVEIKARAHRIWIQDGCPEGQALSHWAQARNELIAESLRK